MQTNKDSDILLSGKEEIKVLLINISVHTCENVKLSKKHLIKNSSNAHTGLCKEKCMK
jgi:hypothetical protein